MDKLLYMWEKKYVFFILENLSPSVAEHETHFLYHLSSSSVDISSWVIQTFRYQIQDIKQHSLSHWKEYRKCMLLLLNIHYFSRWMLLWHWFVLLKETFSHFYASALCMCPCELNGLTSNLLGLMIKLLLFTLQESSHSRAYYSPLYTPMSQSGREQNEQKLERLRCDSDREFAIY